MLELGKGLMTFENTNGTMLKMRGVSCGICRY